MCFPFYGQECVNLIVGLYGPQVSRLRETSFSEVEVLRPAERLGSLFMCHFDNFLIRFTRDGDAALGGGFVER